MKDTFITSRNIISSCWHRFFSFSAFVKERAQIWNSTALDETKRCLPHRPYVCTFINFSKQREILNNSKSWLKPYCGRSSSRIFFFICHNSVLSKKGFFPLLWLLRDLFLFHDNLSLFFYHACNGLDLSLEKEETEMVTLRSNIVVRFSIWKRSTRNLLL